jgi:hypothetical protein
MRKGHCRVCEEHESDPKVLMHTKNYAGSALPLVSGKKIHANGAVLGEGLGVAAGGARV